MDNVLVNFTTGDQSGLTDAASGLDKIIQKNGQVGESWKQASANIDAQTKTNVTSTNKLAQSIDQLATASKTLDKAVIGGAYANYLKQIQQQLGLTSKELVTYIQNARKAAQAEIFNPANSKDKIDELTLSIQVMDDQLKKLGVSADGTKTAATRFTSELRAMKDELLTMAQNGAAGTPEFEALKTKIVDTQQELSNFNKEVKNSASDTRRLDGLVSLMTGVAGAYSVAQGAAALFGGANEDVAKALLKVQAAVAILNGLQEVADVLQKESSANILLNSLFRQKNAQAIEVQATATEAEVAASSADAAAKGLETAATAEATVAQEGLNVAMEANPVGVVLVGILALTTALSALNDNTRLAAELQDEFNSNLNEATKFADFDIEAQKKRNEVIIANAKTEGQSQAQLIALQGNLDNEVLASIQKKRDAAAKAANEELDQINKLQAAGFDVDKTLYDSYDKLIQGKEALDKQYNDLYQQQLLHRAQLEQQINQDNIKSYNAYINSQVAMATAGTDAERNAQIRALQEIQAARKAGNDPSFNSLSPGEKFLAEAEAEKQIEALQLQNYQHYLKGRADLYAAYLADAKRGLVQNQVDSIASINRVTEAQIAALKEQEKAQLANPTLNEGERAKIVAETNLQIATLQRQQQQQLLEIQKSGINAQLELTKKGTLEEYQLKLAAIENEQKIELSATQLTQQQIDEIKNKSLKVRQDAERAFTQAQLQNEIARDNAALDHFGVTESDKLELTIKRLNDQRALEISQADQNAAAIAAIDAKYDKQIRDAKIASIDAVKTKELAAYQAYHDEVINLDKRIADSNLNAQLRISAIEDLKQEQEAELQIEIDALNKKKGLIEDYDVQYQILMNKKRAIAEDTETKITAAEKEEIDKRVARVKDAFDFFKQGFQSFLPQDSFSVALSSLSDFGTKSYDIFKNLSGQIDHFNRIIYGSFATTGEKAAALQQKIDAKREAVKAAEVAATQAAQNIVDQIYQDGVARRQELLQDELDAVENEKNKELANQNLTKQQQADITARYDAKEKALKLQNWKADQKAKKSQAVIDGLLAIARTFATFGFPAGIIPAALQAAETAIIVAKIGSQTPPKFRHGKIDIQGPGTSTSDSIHAMISKGESVIPAEPTAKWKDALVAIKDDHFENYLLKKFNGFVFPVVPDSVKDAGGSIDYERLAGAIATKMKGVIPGAKSMHFNIDKSGIHTIVVEGNTRTEFKNKRYSMS